MTLFEEFDEICFGFPVLITFACDLKNLNPEQEFRQYHYHEEYSPNRQYTKEEFNFNFGKGLHNYQYELHNIIDYDSDDNKHFVVAKEILSKEEQNTLSKYCNCSYCKANFINKMFICSCCVGCLKEENPSQKVIDKAREKLYDKSK